MNQTPPGLISFVVRAIAGLAFIGLASLCASMFMHTYADPAILTAIITVTGGLIGSLGTILSSPRSAMTTTTSTTDQAGAVTTTTKPVILAPIGMVNPTAAATPVEIKQPANNPVPVTEVPEAGH